MYDKVVHYSMIVSGTEFWLPTGVINLLMTTGKLGSP